MLRCSASPFLRHGLISRKRGIFLKEIKTEREDVHKGEKDKIHHGTATGQK